MSTLPQEPWRQLPAEAAAVVRPELPALRDEILEVIAAEVPDYARPFEGSFGRGIRRGVEEALRNFADLIEDPDSPRATSREVYVQLGAGEMRQGRSLDALQAAYRVGARVAWRRIAAAGLRTGLRPEVLSDLADAIFAYIDELAASSVEGYAQAQQEAAGARERRRRELLAAVLAHEFDAEAVDRHAREATWTQPRQVAVLACDLDDLDFVARRLTQDALPGVVDGTACVVIPDPAGPRRRAMIERACRDHNAALGPARALSRARESLTWAQLGLDAIKAGALPDAFAAVDDHLAAIALFDARGPMRDLAASRLSPLEKLTGQAREKMRETLRAYLDHRGNAAAMATDLHLHPQTVRYRLRQLRELFGDELEDPQARFELELALRSA
ncbi:MAG: PucR family transcriptional regulator [Thermoleophilaceae bacterium]